MVDTAYVIDVFVNQFCDISGHGEGQTYVGSTGVITDSAGSASFSAVFAITNLPGRMFAAVATDPQNNTSEFSRCIPAVSTLPALIYTVTNTNDSGPGSLRQAIFDANENINSGDCIYFDIPGAGPHTIAPVSTLPFITDTVHIDGYTQPGATPNTLSNGFDANIKIRLDGRESISNLEVTAGEASIRGLSIIRFNGGGIEMISNSWACRIQGNLIGLDVDGTAMGNIGSGVLVDTHSHVIGGSNPADRNVIGGHTQHGIHLGMNAHNVIAQGNFVGTDPSGRFARTNQGCGFYYIGARDSLIGGTQPGTGNLISGNRVHGIEINQNAARITVQGNYIGTDISGILPLPNSRGHGVFVGRTGFTNSVGNTIGGLTPGAENLIAFNAEDGVHIEWGTNHSIRANSIHSNGQLGIDLGMIEVGPPNDVGDGDSGANEFQNHPILPATTNEFGNAHIVGSLNSRPNRSHDIDFYANKVCDSTGRGEGETYLGSLRVTTDASGNASFSTALPLKNPDEHWITSTATDSFGNTSEFSPCVLMTPAEARLGLLIEADSLIIQWPSFVPSTFVLETTTNLSVQDSWEPVQGQIMDDGNVRSFDVIPDPSEPARFYRLRESGL